MRKSYLLDLTEEETVMLQQIHLSLNVGAPTYIAGVVREAIKRDYPAAERHFEERAAARSKQVPKA